MSKKFKPQAVATNNGSTIFRQYKTLGYISNQVPAVTRYLQRRKETLIATCIGRSFQIYTASHCRVVLYGAIHPDEITALAIDPWYIFTASEQIIYAWRSGKYVTHTCTGHQSRIHTLMPFGRHLVAIDDDNILKVWDVRNEEVYLEIPFAKEEFTISAVAHPPTYVNKIVIGSQQGSLQIWNLKDNRLMYKFSAYESAVTCIEPSPALDVVAVGHKDGTIILLNLKFDEEVMRFKQDCGSVNGISFRTDGVPSMVTSSSDGSLSFWNLDERRTEGHMQAHEDSVTTVKCFPNEPLMLTTSPDNSMKLWIFDMPDQSARLLRSREGHTAPPLCIRYHGSQGVSIMSAGEDSTMRVFNTLSDSLNKSMGRASYNRKVSKKKNRFDEDNLRMPPIIEFTAETTREKEWDNVAAIHAGIIQTTTWSFDKNRMGDHRLVPEQFQNKNRTNFDVETTCLTLTHCGNFVVIGYSSGDLERFNIQSGIHRASYGDPRAHETPIRGVVTDHLNQFVVSGCSNGALKFWPFKHNVNKCLSLIRMEDGIAVIRMHRENSVLGIALDNFTIILIDADTREIMRRFQGHTAKINDMIFSPNCQWIITAAMDATIKVWHISSSYMIDHFRVERPCISLTMSPDGNFLATAHVNYLGIYLWANKCIFGNVTLRPIDPYSEAPQIELPTNALDADSDAESETDTEPETNTVETLTAEVGKLNFNEVDPKYESPGQLSKDLITLSNLPESRWKNLLDLELIKKRNKPKTRTKPKQAPFFLPTVGGNDITFDLQTAQNSSEKSTKDLLADFDNLTIFGKMLQETAKSNDFEKCIEFLKKLGPAMIDFEIKSLLPLIQGPCVAGVQFLKLVEYMLSTNLNFELAQAWLSVFLRAHHLKLIQYPDVVEAMKHLSKVQENSWSRIEDKLMSGMGVLGAVRNFVHK